MIVLLLSEQKLDIVLKKKSIQLQDIYINGTRTDDKMPFTYKNFSRESIEKKNFGEDIPYLLAFLHQLFQRLMVVQV